MDYQKENNQKNMPFNELSALSQDQKNVPIITRGQCAIQTLSNYLESGVIKPDEIDHTMTLLASMNDKDMMATLIESHRCRELEHAAKAYRCPN